MQATMTDTDGAHVAIFTSPGMGHLIPFCALAERLATSFACRVTLILLKDFSATREAAPFVHRLERRGLSVDVIFLENIDTGNASMSAEARIGHIIGHSIPRVVDVLRKLRSGPSPPDAFIIDFFCSTVIRSLSDLHIPTYVFLTASAAFTEVILSTPRLTSQISASFRDVEFGIQLPGLPPIPGYQMPNPLLDRADPGFDAFVDACAGVYDAAGAIVDTFEELEPETLAALRRALPNLHAVGPMVPDADAEIDGECLAWLEAQPAESVVFVSFGSGATPSAEQLTEIADALESAETRFLWVVRKQIVAGNKFSAYFGIPETDLREWLPSGFLERVRGSRRGLVVPSWVPQLAVLRHPAVGGFVSHCGWNSTKESIACGVPMVTWPMFAEQHMNAIMINKVYGVGVQLRMERDGFVRSADLRDAVRELMHGRRGARARSRARQLAASTAAAAMPGGSSWSAMADIVKLWRRNVLE